MKRSPQFFFARAMRRNMTPEERKFWLAINQQNRIYGRWRRQVSFGKYIVDFCCHEHRLMVEIDGAHHDADVDAARNEFLESEGYKILRYNNQFVNQNLNAVVDDVLAHIPPPKNSAAS